SHRRRASPYGRGEPATGKRAYSEILGTEPGSEGGGTVCASAGARVTAKSAPIIAPSNDREIFLAKPRDAPEPSIGSSPGVGRSIHRPGFAASRRRVTPLISG